MIRLIPLASLLVSLFAHAELSVPAATGYFDPHPNGASIDQVRGITAWHDPGLRVLWYGELKAAGGLTASVRVRLEQGKASKLQLAIGEQKHAAQVQDGVASFGNYEITKPGYVCFELTSLNGHEDAGAVEALILDGTAAQGAHFNLDPRRNAASVHLLYPQPKEVNVAMFYNEVTAVEDPVASYYMACGFSRGYFGMQVNSATERRIIFSIWDSGAGQGAKDRSAVAADDQTQLLGKGEGVEASVFGNEGTGGHSHLVYPWKTGEAQKFVVVVKPSGNHSDYFGYWLHPEKKAWQLIAGFRAPKDGQWLRGLYSFSENFGGSTGNLRRKALYGPQWIATDSGQWLELTEARFSHDATGKTQRLDRYMGVEDGRFFLSHGGFIAGSTAYGEAYHRPATQPPVLLLPR
jgi:hypothetical protein